MSNRANRRPAPVTSPPTPQPASPQRLYHGVIERVGSIALHGWAVDLTNPGFPASLILVVDGRPRCVFVSTDKRDDVTALGLPGAAAGFRLDLPDDVFDGAIHAVSIRFRTGGPLGILTSEGEQQGEIRTRFQPTTVTGTIDGMSGSSIRGWAFRHDERTGRRSGDITVDVLSNGVRIDQVKAGLIRNDVAEVHGCEPHCGFRYELPPRFRDGRPFLLEFEAAPDGTPLSGSPFQGQAPMRSSMDQLHGMYAKVQTLCTQLYSLKDQLRGMVSTEEPTLDAYHGWAAGYFACLQARLVAERRTPRYAELLGADAPTVSVICPAYKPNLAEFAAAIDSVRRQTWTKWELIILDDGSGSRALTELIGQYCSQDTRIRAIRHKANRGISAATNTAITAATGEYVALFDHDDLLVDVALEIMLLTARQTGARVLYSDEDKIDEYGKLSEPHLKPDWNYRLALTNNYVCHLLMIERSLLLEVGQLDSRYNGAQDHDLVLRLSEALPPGAIHHVAEILYHWRKSATSTAGSLSSKRYAVEAGRQAVLAHIRRRGLPASVTAPFDTTFFDVRWRFTAEPKISILIPFKDQLDTTRRCVECILANTDYGNYDIALIDNWSNEPATMAWLASLRSEPRIRVFRIEERFNFSRINNLVAQQVDGEFLLFMNNDIFVSQRDWMRLMVDEALADPKVGIVGIRLLYPNGMVQHAGVVLGVGGVADHTFRFYQPDAPGYFYRSVCAQDLSAVTAACMLCRADAFRDVGMFDAEKLAVAFNDVDLCLKVGRAGYRIVYTAGVVAEHCESLSRGNDLAEHNLTRFYDENQTMIDRWGALIGRDPFYNQHFSHETGMFEKLSNASLDIAHAPPLLPPLDPPHPPHRLR